MPRQPRGRLFPRLVLLLALVVAAALVPPGVKSQATSLLTAADVARIVNQAVNEAVAAGFLANIAVTDRYGNFLAIYQMAGAPNSTTIDGQGGNPVAGVAGTGLQGLPSGAAPGQVAVAGFLLSKAGTAAYLSSNQNAFTTRTASFIIQPNFPPGTTNTPIGGPLFGVQFSNLLCDVVARTPLPFGVSGDPGGVPLYKNNQLVGAIGVEGDGAYTIDRNPYDDDAPVEERVATAGQQGFAPPGSVRADTIFIDGIRLPYAIAQPTTNNANTPPRGTGSYIVPASAAGPSPYVLTTTVSGIVGNMDPRFPVRVQPRSILTLQDVATILDQAAQQALNTRAAIRQPLGSNARVNTAVVDTDGTILGVFQNVDAPMFGFDVSVQKARTAVFFSGPGVRQSLTNANPALAQYLPGSLPFDTTIAWSTRAIGFIAQPLSPPGLSGTPAGPMSRPMSQWSVFNTGLQLDMVLPPLVNGVTGAQAVNPNQGCTAPSLSLLRNGITIFPGGIPLYKNGQLAGGVGVSGDGVDQDDLIAAAGAVGYDQLPSGVQRSDTQSYNGVRLPYLKFPRNPNLNQ